MVNDQIKEVIFLGMPGPTHHYGGLSPDNVAATSSRGNVSRPKSAALQVLELARLLKRLGVETAILPPPLRPYMPLLRQRFSGNDDAVIKQAAKEAPELLDQASSASAMWAANAATIAPGVDCADGKLHITPANLFTNIHRRIEAHDTHRLLAAIFKHVPECEVHFPLPLREGAGGGAVSMDSSASDTHHPPPRPSPSRGEGEERRDEGAANHMRLSPTHSARGLHIFVYGTDGSPGDPAAARQTLSASQAVAAQHRIPGAQALFLKQNPEAIGAGVFHNDVIAVSNEHVLLAHEQAYGKDGLKQITQAYEALHPGNKLTLIVIGKDELSLEEAVHTYLFNSQIVTKPGGAMAVIAPQETQSLYGGKAAKLLERLRADPGNPIDEIHYADLRQSMKNGGGPACLRLRVPMTGAQLAALKNNVRVLADEKLLGVMEQLIEKHYPESLSPQDLGNPALYHSGKAMLKEMEEVMGF